MYYAPMTIDPMDPRSPSVQIADYLRAQIQEGENGKLGPGAQLPSERVLADQFGVSPQTIRQAVDALKHEGRVVGQPGRGVFVVSAAPLIRLGSERFKKSFRQQGKSAQQADAEAAGLTFRQEVLELEDVPAPADIAELLGVAEGTLVFKRVRREYVDEVANQIATSHWRTEDVEGTAIREVVTGPGGSLARLEDAGFVFTKYRVEHGPARMPEPEERKLLRIGKGVPVADSVRHVFGYRASTGETAEQARILEVFQSVVNGPMIKFTYEFDAE